MANCNAINNSLTIRKEATPYVLLTDKPAVLYFKFHNYHRFSPEIPDLLYHPLWERKHNAPMMFTHMRALASAFYACLSSR